MDATSIYNKSNMHAIAEKTSRGRQEVEVRARISPKQKNALARALKERRAVFAGNEQFIDCYLCPSAVKSFSEIAMDKVGSYSLRIRKKVVNQHTVVEINTKTITTHGDHSAWEEHEIQVDSFEEALAIFEAVGFKIFFRLKKQRASYALNQMSVLIEDVADFGSVIEVEVLTTAAEAEKVKESIRAFLHEIGITKEQIAPKSITSILMREKAFF